MKWLQIITLLAVTTTVSTNSITVECTSDNPCGVINLSTSDLTIIKCSGKQSCRDNLLKEYQPHKRVLLLCYEGGCGGLSLSHKEDQLAVKCLNNGCRESPSVEYLHNITCHATPLYSNCPSAYEENTAVASGAWCPVSCPIGRVKGIFTRALCKNGVWIATDKGFTHNAPYDPSTVCGGNPLLSQHSIARRSIRALVVTATLSLSDTGLYLCYLIFQVVECMSPQLSFSSVL